MNATGWSHVIASGDGDVASTGHCFSCHDDITISCDLQRTGIAVDVALNDNVGIDIGCRPRLNRQRSFSVDLVVASISLNEDGIEYARHIGNGEIRTFDHNIARRDDCTSSQNLNSTSIVAVSVGSEGQIRIHSSC